ncbi:phosphonate C-P lyase system protein PhnH [Chelativorans sp. AA-79]|uniref:phosphonate C-P lyase system protein PhnH n=1 Tax=Chelativorans sp. AA-79 TaxID=3028735 RepID=UPI0023F8A62C|nr:phosphonate C-P lyase system protein PhnH [Chelativorans sp. AA-79]WEX09457.1 phosphonate C-P lyase system protein PhnH [Chelativorans sp. AA-79]
MEAVTIEGGFPDPVFDAQATFRAVMDAMARPGTVARGVHLPRPPAPLMPEAGAVALALCDADTPMWIDPLLREDKAVAGWLGFQTGAPLVREPADAHFAFVSDPANLPAFENFAQGSQEYPDRSATLVLQVETLTSGEALRLEGPGIETFVMLSPRPLPRHFVEQWAQNRTRFPRGIDLILVCREGLAALPRTTKISKEA